MTFPFMTGLLHYDYPFNVRELEAFIKRGVALCDGTELDTPHLPLEITELMKAYALVKGPGHAPSPVHGGTPAEDPGARGAHVPTEAELRASLAQHRGNVAAVGREFGKERMQVHRWMKKFGIDVDEFR